MRNTTFEEIYEMVTGFERTDLSQIRRFFIEKAINDHTIFHSLHSSNHPEEKNLKRLYLITGSIAAGKSTIAYHLIRHLKLGKLPYVSSDTYYEAFFLKNGFQAGYEKARSLTMSILSKYETNGISFVWETVLSKRQKWEYLRKLKDERYELICFFVDVGKYDVAVSRSKKREMEGYHEVNKNFILDRYRKSMKTVEQLCSLCDKIIILNNSSSLKLAFYRDSSISYVNKEALNYELAEELKRYCQNVLFRD